MSRHAAMGSRLAATLMRHPAHRFARGVPLPQCADGCLCFLDSKTCSRAANAGHLECLKYAHENGCSWGENEYNVCNVAANAGHLECLKYAHENGCPWDEDTCWSAAVGGHILCLKYAHEQGCPWDGWTCSYAAKSGHLECLKYAHEQGCPWDGWTWYYAAVDGHLECLKYAHEQGCPWDDWTCSHAAEGGHILCLEYAHDHGCPWDKETSSFIGSVQHDRDLYIAVIIYDKMPKSKATTAKAIIDKVHLLRRMKDAYRHAAATRIQRIWKERMYRPGGAGMLSACKRFCLMSQNA